MRAHVITVSDRVAGGQYEDRTGPHLSDWLVRAGWQVSSRVVPDGAEAVQSAVRAAIAEGSRLILTTGGTGVTERDQSPQAVEALLQIQTPGIIEAIRAEGRRSGVVGALLSRGVSGVADGPRGRVFIATLPGSMGAVRDAAAVLDPLLAHLVDQLDNGGH